MFEQLEETGLAIWVGESMWGYPIMLSLHAVGLAVVVGLLFIVNLRVLGYFNGIPFQSLRDLMKLAWVAFVVNLISGFALFTSQASYFITNRQFLIKIIAIFVAIILAGIFQARLRQNATAWDNGTAVPASTTMLAWLSILLWSVAMIAGRLIAYL